MSTALISSYEKNGSLLRLARLLVKNGWNLLGSLGTSTYLKRNGVACKDISDTIGPPILGHRVVTLSREIYAGLLAVTDADFKELERLNIPVIDLVYVNLYPLENECKNPQSTPESVLEKTDIGGPTLLRAAAKGRRLALSSPEQIDVLESWFMRGSLKASESSWCSALRRKPNAESLIISPHLQVTGRKYDLVCRGALALIGFECLQGYFRTRFVLFL